MFLYISSRTTDLFCGYEDSNTPVNTQKLSAFQVVVFDTRLVLITVTSHFHWSAKFFDAIGLFELY